jgi:hypothetical protein
MRIPSLLALVLLIACVAPVSLAEARPADGGATTAAAKQPAKKVKARAKAKAKAKRRATCRKGYVRKSVKVKRKGKMVRVTRCRKRKPKNVAKPPPATPQPQQPAPVPPAPPPGAPQPLFDPPGVQLTGAAARPFFEKYLHGSRFTDCPGSWPACASEQRFSHFANGRFFACQFPMAAGGSIPPQLEYALQVTVVNADGSWSFDAEVAGSSGHSLYHWEVSTDGTATGWRHAPGAGLTNLGPLRYVAGASNCTA